MIYTLDLPTSSPALNSRLGYSLPKSILLPPYLAINPYFVGYTNAIDEVFGELVDAKLDAFHNIRNMWVDSPDVEAKIEAQAMVAFEDWGIPEKPLLIKQVNLLGMKLSNSGVITESAYLALSRFVGQYWLEKGKYAAIDFLNFCLSQDFTLVKLWTEDYDTFVPEGDARIGIPLWDGGTWYPTTHVSLTVKGNLEMEPQVLTKFFDDVANYNLVLQSIEQVFDIPIVPTYESTTADIVAVALLCENALVISNKDSFGADPPPMNTFDWVSTLFYSTVGPQVSYFLGQPSGWIKTHDGKKLPVYGKAYQASAFAHSLPTKCFGEGKVLCGDNLVWVKVPGSNRSPARIPGYMSRTALATTDSFIYEFLVTDVNDVPIVNAGCMVDALTPVDAYAPEFIGLVAFMEGVHPRTYFGVSPIPITSPQGLYELYPNVWVPYW